MQESSAAEFLLRLGKNVPLWCHGYHGISQQTFGFKRNRVKPGLDEVILEDVFWVWLQSLPLCEMTRSLVVAAGYLLLITCLPLDKVPYRPSVSPVPRTARLVSWRRSLFFFLHDLSLWVQAKPLDRS